VVNVQVQIYIIGVSGEVNLHWFPMAGFLEDFRRHVAWGPACCGKDVKCLFIHYSRETKVGYQQVRVVFGGSEEEVLGFQISVHYAVVVEIGNRRKGRTDEVRGVGLIIASFPAYSVEELTSESEVGYEVYYTAGCQCGAEDSKAECPYGCS